MTITELQTNLQSATLRGGGSYTITSIECNLSGIPMKVVGKIGTADASWNVNGLYITNTQDRTKDLIIVHTT
jgi:hypothetical protein